jgi:dihydrofolate reductase
MSKIIVSEFLSLDGIMEDPGGAEKSKYGGWSFLSWSMDAGKYKFDELFAAGALLLGRITYEGFAKAWPSMSDKNGFADRMNNLPKYVVSGSLENPLWNNTTVINGDLVDKILELKSKSEHDILVFGSAQLVNSLYELGLIDEFRLMVHPVILGTGKRLFIEDCGLHRLKLVQVSLFEAGIVLLTYLHSGA